MTLPATRTADGWTLSGAKHFVLDSATAQLIIVPARTANGVSLFAVDAAASGLTRRPSSPSTRPASSRWSSSTAPRPG